MAREVYLHIGLPKTGTTYLQGIIWSQRKVLRSERVLLPGANHREHLWAALEAQGRDVTKRHRSAVGSWDRLVAQVREWPQKAVISHEFWCAASAEQAAAAVAALAPAEVHLIVTARDALGMLTAGWQESVKNGGRRGLAQSARRKAGGTASEFSWRTWDLGGVLRRWGPTVAPDRVHVIPVPAPGQPADQHWRNFADTVGLTADRYTLPEGATNTSLGVVQVELLRRINAHLVSSGAGFKGATDRGVWIRSYLAEGHLVGQGGPKAGPGKETVEICRRRSHRAVDLIEKHGYHVVGSPQQLLVPDLIPALPSPEEVADSELVDAAAELVADMLRDVRRMKRELGNRGSSETGQLS